MDMELKTAFIERWEEYFPGAELPLILFYTDDAERVEMAEVPGEHRCFLAQLAAVRKGRPLRFDASNVGCPGGRRYLGFCQEIMPDFEYFLSCGIPGKLEGERYKKSPALVQQVLRNAPVFHAPESYVVLKRWDQIEPDEEPEVVIFFAKPDALSGLFTLAGFDEDDLNAVITPFSAGCGSIVQFPFLEKTNDRPRCVIGMFDVSARPFVRSDILTFAAPMSKFTRMIENMPESFLITGSWDKVSKRMRAAGPQ